MLQNRLAENGYTILNFTGDRIMVDYFYNEGMHEKFLSGCGCWLGKGMYDLGEQLEFNRLPDSNVVVVQKDGVETAKYKYKTLFTSTIEYKETNKRRVSFSIRKNMFGEGINLVLGQKEYLDLSDIDEVKVYLEKRYGNYTLTKEWDASVSCPQRK
ncbi:MAG: hypothetical protein GX316_06320 [Firmicutes bacterium]|nr:hypothetical protein [Bacillota bacterium]